MHTKRLMQELSQRLEPLRDEFSLRLYHWSLGILEPQISDDASLFWKVPSRVIRNLHRLLSSDEDPLRFFNLCHGCRHRSALSRLGQPVPSAEDMSRDLGRCIDPARADVTHRGLLPFSTTVSRLNRRKLHSTIRVRLAPLFEEKTDPSDHSEWLFETRVEPWHLVARITAPSSDFQLDLEFDVILGMGDLSLRRQLSLHGLFGIGPSAWDLAKPGEEEKVAELVEEYCRFMLDSVSPLLADLDPGISLGEVRRAEQEWIEWLHEVRAARQRRSQPRS